MHPPFTRHKWNTVGRNKKGGLSQTTIVLFLNWLIDDYISCVYEFKRHKDTPRFAG